MNQAMSRRARSSDEIPREKGADTLPPPDSDDAYSAQTRVGTLPEEILAAMRVNTPDAAFANRRAEGWRAPSSAPPLSPPAVVLGDASRLAPAAVPSVASVASVGSMRPMPTPLRPIMLLGSEELRQRPPTPPPFIPFDAPNADVDAIVAEARRRRVRVLVTVLAVLACGTFGSLVAAAIALARG